MDHENQPYELRFLSTALLKCALIYEKQGGTKKKWMDTALEVWDHMQRVDKYELNKALFARTKEHLKERGIEVLKTEPDEVD